MVLENLYNALVWNDVEKAESFFRQALQTEGLAVSVADVIKRGNGDRWGVVVYIETPKIDEWMEINTVNGEIAYCEPEEYNHESVGVGMDSMIEKVVDEECE